jgi:hypothetical protein
MIGEEKELEYDTHRHKTHTTWLYAKYIFKNKA